MDIHNIQLNFMWDQVRDMNEDQRMVMCESIHFDEENHNITAGRASEGLIDHGPHQTDENNRIRQELLDACKQEFRVKRFADLPKAVRDAFKVTSFKDDLKLEMVGGKEKVTSGRPLTARRIRQVIAAVSDEVGRRDDLAKGEKIAWTTYSDSCKAVDKEPQREVFDYFCAQAKNLPTTTLHVFDNGVNVKSFQSFVKGLHRFETTLYANMPEEAVHAANGGDGEICRFIFVSVVVGRLSGEVRDELVDFINTPECMKYLHDVHDKFDDDSFSVAQIHDFVDEYDFAAQLRLAIADFEGVTAIDD